MGIKIDYSPAFPALSLAKAAGEGQRKAQAVSQDLQLINLSMQQQALRDRRQESDRAFAMQQAMAGRAARTPTARAEIKSPMADPAMLRQMQKQQYGEFGQSQQMQQLNQMLESGSIDSTTYEQNKLRIMGGQSVRFDEAEKAPLSVRRLPFTQKRSMLEKELDNVLKWEGSPNPEENPWKSEEALQSHKQQIIRRLQTLTVEEQSAFGMGPVDPTAQGSTAPTVAASSPPPGRGNRKGHQRRNTDTGELWEWDGSDWNSVGS